LIAAWTRSVVAPPPGIPKIRSIPWFFRTSEITSTVFAMILLFVFGGLKMDASKDYLAKPSSFSTLP
jgi:hypothetical protein